MGTDYKLEALPRDTELFGVVVTVCETEEELPEIVPDTTIYTATIVRLKDDPKGVWRVVVTKKEKKSLPPLSADVLRLAGNLEEAEGLRQLKKLVHEACQVRVRWLPVLPQTNPRSYAPYAVITEA